MFVFTKTWVLLGIMALTGFSGANAQEVFAIGGKQIECQKQQNVGRAGFVLLNPEVAVVSGAVEVRVDVRLATCQANFSWTLSDPWASFSYPMYDPTAGNYYTVSVASSQLKLNAFNPQTSKVVGSAEVSREAGAKSQVSFALDKFLTPQQLQQLERGGVQVAFWIVQNGVHAFSTSTGSKIEPSLKASAKLVVRVQLEKVGDQIVLK